ncbi:hypothetical protein, partial [Oleiphilus sp. HI0132]
AIPAFLHPISQGGIPISEETLFRDYALMFALTFGLAAMVYIKHATKKNSLGPVAGTLLLAIYGGYLYVLYEQTVLA